MELVNSKDKASKEKTYEIVKEFSNRFKDINGSIICKELLDFDLSNKINSLNSEIY